MKLKIAYLYSKELNLYGDTGNVEIIYYRAKKRDLDVEVVELGIHDSFNSETLADVDFLFMGGGPDSSQQDVYDDLKNKKGPYVRDYVESGGYGLFICGSYQLLGNYYKSADGSILEGLGIFDMYTEHFGNHKPRCVGNMVCTINEDITKSPEFIKANLTLKSNKLVGFENHGGRTYLAGGLNPLATVDAGFGNNGEDKGEGLHYKNSFGTYFHGPLLSKNPHFADMLIMQTLGLDELKELDDNIIYIAHNFARKLS